ncbi:MAG: catalase family peroxidase, partial [Rhodospirillales bacterium]|nr:catalase family peroxidase [Rhodospirillales bacterium]
MPRPRPAATSSSRASSGPRRAVGAAIIAIACSASAAAFAYTGGWLTPSRLTPERIVDALSMRGGDPVGHRRNHSKGICVLGTFEASGAGTALSTAPMLVRGSYPVIGRFAIATGNPMADDASGRVRSLAIRIVAPDGQEWRSGMNNSPVFVVATPQAFYEQTVAAEIDPATGRPNPQALEHFAATHRETAPFAQWAKTAPWTTSYADQQYNSLNAFRFIDAQGASHAVRWSLVPTTAPDIVPVAALAARGPDFLERDLKARLAKGPLTWHLVATLAAPGDPTADATKAWPPDRPTVTLGTLHVTAAQDEANGACRDINYDPTVLPTGIKPSDDPLLAARSATYADSFDRRTAEL